LFALGAGRRVVGVTRYCDRPAEAAALARVGGNDDASLEAVLALHPDLVVAMPTQGQRALIDVVRARGVRVVLVRADSDDDTRAAMRTLGALVGAGAAAEALIARQQRTLDELAARARGGGRVVAVVVGHDPIVVAGPGTLADVAVRATGARSAVGPAEPSWPQWSLESFLARRVEVVVAAEGARGAERLRGSLAALGDRAPVVVAAPDMILMRPGPSFPDDALVLERLLSSEPPR
jgi:iron complex transport system substrate-binding protein